MAEREKPPSRLKPLGILFQDETGAVLVAPLRLNVVPQKRPRRGAPKKTLRDVAMLMHVEYLSGPGGMTKGDAIERVAEMFGLADPKRIWSTLKSVREEHIKGFKLSFAMAGEPARDGSPKGQVMAIFESAEAVQKTVDGRGTHLAIDGTGFIVEWGTRAATFGRITGRGSTDPST